jgi:hypothetical protein
VTTVSFGAAEPSSTDLRTLTAFALGRRHRLDERLVIERTTTPIG